MVEADRDSGNFRISSHLACHHVRSSGRVKRGIRNVGHATLLAVLLLAAPLCAVAFVSNSGSLGYTSNAASPSASRPINPTFLPPSSVNIPSRAASSSSQTKLNMFMGSDGGILGIGTPELFTILLVGYFVLGPSDLYKLTKEIGKFVQNFRTFTAEATSTLENSFESQLQLEEIRKAQRELNDAFSFRRSINVDSDSDPFEVNAQSPREPSTEPSAVADTAVAAETAVAEGTAPRKKKIRRRRVKKKKETLDEEKNEEDVDGFRVSNDDINNTATVARSEIPDLSMDDVDRSMSESEESAAKAWEEANEELRKEAMDEEAAQRRKERVERLQQSAGDTSASSEEELQAASARFQAQLSGNWNDQILSKGDELNPLASIMERLAILEQEKQAADERLQEEFRMREENEERFYREKRQLLEEAAAQTQAEVYVKPSSDENNNGSPLPQAVEASKASETKNTTATVGAKA